MNKIRVVLIEDHDLTRFSIKVELRRSGWVDVVGEAATAIAGLGLITELQPDVAIVDIDLPDMSGIELVRQFKASWMFTVPTRILILSLQDSLEFLQAAIAAGADSYCVKTSSSHHLLTAIQMTHRGQSWIDPKFQASLNTASLPIA